MRHLEAAAIGLVFAIASVYMAVLEFRQATPVHHVSAQRALAWALLRAQEPEEVARLASLALEGGADVYVGALGSEPPSSGWVCYSAVLLNRGSVAVVSVCAKP